jgi:hypothetical protein
MSSFNDFLDLVNRGQEGNSVFMPLRQQKLGSKISVTKAMYILLGGMPGSGKTAIVDSVFVLDMYDWWLDNREFTKIKPHWIYRSMERNRTYKLAKWMCYKLYKDHDLLIDVPTLFNWPNKLFDLTLEIMTLIKGYDSYFEELEKHITIIDGTMNPTGIYNYARDFAQKRGQVVKIDEHNKKFIPNDPNEIWFHITDHIGKIRTETISGTNMTYNDKGILDKHAEYMGILRDFYMFTVIDISQLNRGIEDTLRGLKTELDVKPADFKGSSDMYENADVVIGLMNPFKLKDFDHMDYDIKEFVDAKGYNRFRSLKVLKNSWGIDDFRIGYQFLGENGIMNELPKASEFNIGLVNYTDYII